MTKRTCDSGSSRKFRLIITCAACIATSAILLCSSLHGNFDNNECPEIVEKTEKFLPKERKESRIAPPSSAPPGGNLDADGSDIIGKLPTLNYQLENRFNKPSLEEEFEPYKPSFSIPKRVKDKKTKESRILSIQEYLSTSRSNNVGKIPGNTAPTKHCRPEGPRSILKHLADELREFCITTEHFWHLLVADRPAWMWTMLCSLLVMSTGVVPAFLIPYNTGADGDVTKGPAIRTEQLNLLLSFAVGSLLGDVFFHLLPESWNDIECTMNTGLWVIAGVLACIVIEKFCSHSESSHHYIAAIANLVANIMDNFTHGLAVGGSFLVSTRLGFLTTFAILIHEIPHEISDFAILLRADFSRLSAIKAQIVTAAGGLVGAAVALMDHGSLDPKTSWILPFTAGGFLNIALVQVLPDLLKEKRVGESLKQISTLLAGIGIMALLNTTFHI